MDDKVEREMGADFPTTVISNVPAYCLQKQVFAGLVNDGGDGVMGDGECRLPFLRESSSNFKIEK